MKRLILTFVVVCLIASPALALWQEDCCPYYYVDASYGGYHNSVPLVIKLDGNSADGQIFAVGESITITGDIHSYAGMCGWYNEAYTEWLLQVSGPSGADSDTDWDYVYSEEDCAELETITTATITYPLTTPGVHTVYMYSDAQVAYAGWDEASDFVEALLTFEVATPVEIDIKPGSFPNSINPNAGGVIPVAILTTDDFDASTVDPETVALEGADARGKGKSGRFGSMEDVDADGDLDLVVQIENVILWAPDATEATLTGLTNDNTPIEGTDSVNIVPPDE
ncbi:MAG: hypothetical protein ACYST5_06595 [Planctomycetota bacterium]|jgi:hypothetical protein